MSQNWAWKKGHFPHPKKPSGMQFLTMRCHSGCGSGCWRHNQRGRTAQCHRKAQNPLRQQQTPVDRGGWTGQGGVWGWFHLQRNQQGESSWIYCKVMHWAINLNKIISAIRMNTEQTALAWNAKFNISVVWNLLFIFWSGFLFSGFFFFLNFFLPLDSHWIFLCKFFPLFSSWNFSAYLYKF